MNDPDAERLHDLLQITMMLRDSIDELLSGLMKQLQATTEVRRQAATKRRRRR